VEALLSGGADPNLQLSHGVGSALCAATFTQNEAKRNLDARIALVRPLFSSASNLPIEDMDHMVSSVFSLLALKLEILEK